MSWKKNFRTDIFFLKRRSRVLRCFFLFLLVVFKHGRGFQISSLGIDFGGRYILVSRLVPYDDRRNAVLQHGRYACSFQGIEAISFPFELRAQTACNESVPVVAEHPVVSDFLAGGEMLAEYVALLAVFHYAKLVDEFDYHMWNGDGGVEAVL